MGWYEVDYGFPFPLYVQHGSSKALEEGVWTWQKGSAVRVWRPCSSHVCQLCNLYHGVNLMRGRGTKSVDDFHHLIVFRPSLT